MRVPGVPYQPRYTPDELVLGLVAAIVMHVVFVAPFVVKVLFPSMISDSDDDKPLVARPVVQATLLKLGKPLDPKRLPDRLVPQQRTAPKKQLIASREDPGVKKPDAGAPPPPDAKDSDLQNLIAKSDPFAEDAGRARPEEGSPGGIEGGTETDPSKVRAGDMYAAQLGQFFAQRLSVPTVISVGEARRLCVLMQMNLGRNMAIWHVRQDPIIKSGNDLFDDAARTMLMKLLDDKTSLPQPPPEVAEQYLGRTVQLVIMGDPHGDSTRCMPKP
jgi:hypothetical protein